MVLGLSIHRIYTPKEDRVEAGVKVEYFTKLITYSVNSIFTKSWKEIAVTFFENSAILKL